MWYCLNCSHNTYKMFHGIVWIVRVMSMRCSEMFCGGDPVSCWLNCSSNIHEMLHDLMLIVHRVYMI